MKAEELRIGNLITSDGEIFTVDEIQPSYIGAGALGVYPLGFTDELCIPLTEEWLGRIDWRGYKDLYFNSYFCLDGSCHLYYRGDYTGINVNYVHQLQNLYYALTGEELKLAQSPQTN